MSPGMLKDKSFQNVTKGSEYVIKTTIENMFLGFTHIKKIQDDS